MKVESLYAVPHPIPIKLPGRTLRSYFYTGERVMPGRYVCTFCGHDTVVDKARILAPCSSCDSSEYTLDAVAA